ncbi:alpha/beta hydrolase [Actinoplanes sp. KI2]|uniref:alpha/beta hydrolase n=1 Tax=Actinoplanes sp. KI2 TaxID=2983315 RepID=UPI0021D56D00|nr:alpha/beta hydrolase [Actinoplanes sp. KI2]MCU7728132.1 alpha/beta hydrolase [Actinoplanes sp. KI2]
MEEIDVAVRGGSLRVLAWPGDGPLVIAAHGITANALSWAAVARELAGRVRLVAPDLRGRARSAGLPGPFGMAAHAADLIAVADHFGAAKVALAGHSMGGFVVTETAARYPTRVSSVLLIDGGVPLPLPPDIDVDTALLATIGPAMRRLSMTFATSDEYLAYFRSNPALGSAWNHDISEYVLRDYTGVRSSCNIDAIRADARDMLTGAAPAEFPLLAAPRGLQDEPTGMYPPALLHAVGAEMVPDVNHYTILLGGGAAHVAKRISEMADPGFTRSALE